jgi:hypothetical protein
MKTFCFAILSAALVGCQHTLPVTSQLPPEQCIEVGTVTAHSVWNTKKALARAGVPAHTDGAQYPSYRILVPPQFRDRAVAVLREIDQRPTSIGYGITHN